MSDDAEGKYGFLTLTFRDAAYEERFKNLISGGVGASSHLSEGARGSDTVQASTDEGSGAGVTRLQHDFEQLPTTKARADGPVDVVQSPGVSSATRVSATQLQAASEAQLSDQGQQTATGSLVQPLIKDEVSPNSTIAHIAAESRVTEINNHAAPAVPRLRLDTDLHETLSVGHTQFNLQAEDSAGPELQDGPRGVKRSRTPDPPSLTSGAPSAVSTPISAASTFSIRQRSPVKRRDSPQKKATAREQAAANTGITSIRAPLQKIVTFKTSNFPEDWILDPETMAPVRDPSDVSNKIKDVIQNLFDVQSQTHGFVPETQELLIGKMEDLTQSLADLQRLTDKNLSPNNPVHNIDLAPEIVDYVDDGRNPDIFTRDFVELVQRGNAVVNGKKQAFRDFSHVYAKALKEGIGGVDKHVDMIMDNAGIEQDDDGRSRRLQGGENGQQT